MNMSDKTRAPISGEAGSIRRTLPPMAIAAFGIAILLSGLLITTLLGHLSTGMAIAMVLAIPAGVILLALAVPQAARNVSSLRGQLNRWHVLWALSYLSALVFQVRGVEASRTNPLSAWGALRIGPEVIILFVLLVGLVSRRTDWIKSLFRGLFGFLAAYCLWSAISTLWSVFPQWTLFKAGEYLLDVSLVAAIVMSLCSVEEYKTFFDWTWTLFGVELVWIWMQAAMWPHEALEDGRLRGVFPATAYNAVGESGAILAIIALCRLIPITRRPLNRAWYACLFVFGVASMLMSQTRNAMGGFALALVVVLLFSRRKMGALVTLGGAALLGFTSLGVLVGTFLKRGQDEAAFSSMTGRLDWWTFAWQQFLQHPFTGLGAYAGGKFAVLGKLGFDAGSTHSDYIELLVGTGIPGLLLFLIPLAGAGLLLFRYFRDSSLGPAEHQLCLESLAVLCILIVHSFFNVELTWHSPMFFLAVLGYAEFLRRRKALSISEKLPVIPPSWAKAHATS